MKKLRVLCQTLFRIVYSIWYGVKFESGYNYKKIKYSNLDLIEKRHNLLLDMGWEQFTAIDEGFNNVRCWYRKKL